VVLAVAPLVNFNPTRVRLKLYSEHSAGPFGSYFNPTRVRLKPCPIVGTQPLI